MGKVTKMLNNNLNEFVWGLEQTDPATAFEQYTTALEMTLLATAQQCKKQVLAKRVAVLLENNPTSITALYGRMLDYYRFRSESLHEGNVQNITDTEMKELESITRTVMSKYLEFCYNGILSNPSITWDEIKTQKINDLKALVQTSIDAGYLPR